MPELFVVSTANDLPIIPDHLQDAAHILHYFLIVRIYLLFQESTL